MSLRSKTPISAKTAHTKTPKPVVKVEEPEPVLGVGSVVTISQKFVVSRMPNNDCPFVGIVPEAGGCVYNFMPYELKIEEQ